MPSCPCFPHMQRHRRALAWATVEGDTAHGLRNLLLRSSFVCVIDAGGGSRSSELSQLRLAARLSDTAGDNLEAAVRKAAAWLSQREHEALVERRSCFRGNQQPDIQNKQRSHFSRVVCGHSCVCVCVWECVCDWSTLWPQDRGKSTQSTHFVVFILATTATVVISKRLMTTRLSIWLKHTSWKHCYRHYKTLFYFYYLTSQTCKL